MATLTEPAKATCCWSMTVIGCVHAHSLEPGDRHRDRALTSYHRAESLYADLIQRDPNHADAYRRLESVQARIAAFPVQ